MKFAINSEIFAGPLDILLQLVQKKKLDITMISLAQIADDFQAYIGELDIENMEQVTSFLHVATILLRIKVQTMFPDSQHFAEEEEVELLLNLMDKKYYAVLADIMTEWETADLGYFRRGANELMIEEEVDPNRFLDEVSLLNLAMTFEQILLEFGKEEEPLSVESFSITIADQVTWLNDMCHLKPRNLVELFRYLPNRFSVVVTFLALLESIRSGVLLVAYETDGQCIVLAAEGKE